MSVAQEIEQILRTNLNIKFLKIIDESHKHIGHSGYKEGGESHFRLQVVSPEFKGMTRLEKQKKIYKLLDELMKKQIHALSLDLTSE